MFAVEGHGAEDIVENGDATVPLLHGENQWRSSAVTSNESLEIRYRDAEDAIFPHRGVEFGLHCCRALLLVLPVLSISAIVAFACIVVDLAAFGGGSVACAALVPGGAGACRATVVFVRHGEKVDSGPGLRPEGQARAAYLARCAGGGGDGGGGGGGGRNFTTRALPRGPPTALIASNADDGSRTGGGGGHPSRAMLTLTPLAELLGLPIDASMNKLDSDGLIDKLEQLQCGQTALVAWEHNNIPALIHALNPTNAPWFYKWPRACPSPSWPEPTSMPGRSDCYDLMWAVQLQRNASVPIGGRGGPFGDAGRPWCADEVRSYREGFAGDPAGECAGGFEYLD